MQKRMQFLKNEMVRIWEFYILYYIIKNGYISRQRSQLMIFF